MESCVKGKISELQVISELLKKGFEVYVPVVDICVDCIVKSQKKEKSAKYFELQIKSVKGKNISIRGGKKILSYIEMNNPDNYFLIFNISKGVEPASELNILFLRPDQIQKFAYKRGIDEITVRLRVKEIKEMKEQNFEKLVALMNT